MPLKHQSPPGLFPGPFQMSRPMRAARAKGGPRVAPRVAMKNRKVLIIEDNRATGAMLSDILGGHGYETRHCLTGKAGLKAVKEYQPGVILLDLMLPDIQGGEICELIREMELPMRPSIIVVSGMDDKESVCDALTRGADDFVAKPVDDMELIARIKAYHRISDFYEVVAEDKRNLELILEITNSVSATLNSMKVLDTIVEKVAEVTKAVRCSILLVSDGDGYVLSSHDNPKAKDLKVDLARYPEIIEAVDTRRHVKIDDMTRHPLMDGVKRQLDGLEGMSVLVVPIVFNERVLGTLFLRARRAGGKSFSDKEIDFCRIVANASVNAIRNAKLYEDVMREREELREISITDQLTTLYNHNFFYARLEEEFERALRYDTPLSLLMLDIDDFKSVNDTYGHRTGDKVLRDAAKLVKAVVRKTDVVCRYGGEEFAVILPHTSMEGAMDDAERIRAAIEAHAFGGLIGEGITVSIGAATYPNDEIRNSGDFVNRADTVLYKAKDGGKNRVVSDAPERVK